MKATQMNDSWSEKIRLFLWHRIPLLTTFALIFLFSMPVHSVDFNYFHPMVALICVFYWFLKCGRIFGYASAFCVGIWLDMISSSPLGVNALLLMMLIFALSFVERYLRVVSFGLVWTVFALISLGFVMAKWLILVLYFGRIFSFEEVFICYLMTIMIYPLIAMINVWIQNKFLQQENFDG